jgi:uncharacterized phage-associated protein
MLITHEREKLLNVIIYFAENTAHCGKTKLFKLLYLLDFEHFKLTGRSVTGLEYYAWKLGPVPAALDDELEQPGEDLAQAIELEPERVIDSSRLTIKAKHVFDPAHFSKRELKLLESLATAYRQQYAQEMVEITHAENEAWERVYANGKGFNKPIPYELAVSGEDSALILSMAKEYAAMRNQYTNG